MTKRKNLRELFLALALFFNPAGYNEVFALIMSATGTYWSAAFVMYGLASTLFIVYLILRWIDKKQG